MAIVGAAMSKSATMRMKPCFVYMKEKASPSEKSRRAVDCRPTTHQRAACAISAAGSCFELLGDYALGGGGSGVVTRPSGISKKTPMASSGGSPAAATNISAAISIPGVHDANASQQSDCAGVSHGVS